MSHSVAPETQPYWKQKRTARSGVVEAGLRRVPELRVPGAEVDAYEYNMASIRLRIVDPRFEGLSQVEREDLIMPTLLDDKNVPADLREDIIWLILVSPREMEAFRLGELKEFGTALALLEFEDPRRSGF